MNLNLHIGFSKTGTTTLQENLFSELPNYLGKSKKNEFKNSTALVNELTKLYLRYSINDTENLKTDVYNWINNCHENYSQFESVIISSEDFTKWPTNNPNNNCFPFDESLSTSSFSKRTKTPPIIEFLELYLKPYWKSGDVKILLTIRNQPEWLASRYAELSDRIQNSCQRNFENQVSKIISTNDPYIDWMNWIIQLERIVSRKNLLVALMEEMDKPTYWIEIATFFGFEISNSSTLISSTNRVNILYLEKRNVWALKQFRIRQVVARNWIRRTKRNHFRSLVLKIIDILDKSSNWALSKRKTIELNDQTRIGILEFVSESNNKLDQYLVKDLRRFGYL